MSRRGACTTCGASIQVDTRGSATPRCKPCRVAATLASRQRTCPTCSATFAGGSARAVYCSSRCAAVAGNQQRSRYGQTLVASKGSRAVREASAPGLTAQQRSALLRCWVRQRRSCAYCPSPATTIDHVVPLLRGGTNHEGNLAPCCRPCNSGKAYLLLVEWRTGLRLPATVVLVQHGRKRKAKPVVATPLALAPCPACGSLFAPDRTVQRYCSATCAVEWQRRAVREHRRARLGLAPTWDVPTGATCTACGALVYQRGRPPTRKDFVCAECVNARTMEKECAEKSSAFMPSSAPVLISAPGGSTTRADGVLTP